MCVHARVCALRQKKKKKHWQANSAKMVDGSVLVLEYDGSLLVHPLVFVCVHVHAVVCVLKIIHEDMPHYLLGKCGLAG